MATKDLKAQIEIGADASGAVAGIQGVKKSLETLGPAAQASGQAAGAGLDQVDKAGKRGAAGVEATTRNIVGSIQRQIAIMEAGSRSGSEYYRVLAGQRGVDPAALKPYLDQLDAVNAKQRAAGAALGTGAKQLNAYGQSAAQTAAALRQVPAQLTDIVVGLQSGQAPLTVLLQQGGQLKDVFGGVVPAARALGGAILGLINPYTLVAGAVAALTAAYAFGSREADAYAKALILTGSASGATVGSLDQMARAISTVAGTQGNAAEALAQFAATGQIGADKLQGFAQAAVLFERATGQAVKDTVQQFVELGKAPVEASTKLNESMRYLTRSTYEQIKALSDAGRETDAAAVAQKAYADAIEQRSGAIVDRLGLIERGWLKIKDATKGALDAALSVGRADTLQTQLADSQKKLADLEAAASQGRGAAIVQAPKIAAERERIALLQEQIRLEGRAALASKSAADQVAARIRFDKDGEQFRTKALQMEQAIAKARIDGAAAGASQAEIEKRIADIREKFTDKGAAGKAARLALGIDKAQLALDIEDIRNAGAAVVDSFSRSEKILESLRAAGIVDDREYYEAKVRLVLGGARAQEQEKQAEIARLQAEKLTGKEAIDNRRAIAKAEAELQKIRDDGAAQVAILGTAEQARIDRLRIGYEQARASAQDFLDTLKRQNDRAVDAVGLGNVGRDRQAGINQIEDRYAQQRLQLESERRQGAYKGREDDYQRDLDLINEYEAKATAAFTDGFERRLAAQRNWVNGASRSLQNYVDSAQDAAGQTEALFNRAFGGLEDSLVNFARTGKLSFRSLADSIISDLIRIQVRAQIAEGVKGGGIFGAIFSALGLATGYSYNGDASGELFSATGADIRGRREFGGPVGARSMYSVVEGGEPEVLRTRKGTYLLTGDEGGQVQPLNRTPSGSAGGGLNITVVNNGAPLQVMDAERYTNGEIRVLVNNMAVQAQKAAVREVNASLTDRNSRFSRTSPQVAPAAR